MNMKLKASVVLLSLASLWSFNASADGSITARGDVSSEPCVPVVSVVGQGGTVSGEDVTFEYGTIPASDFEGNGVQNRTIVYNFADCPLDSIGLRLSGTADTDDANAWKLEGNTNLAMYTADADATDTVITPEDPEMIADISEIKSFGLLLTIKPKTGQTVRAGEFSGTLNTEIFEG